MFKERENYNNKKYKKRYKIGSLNYKTFTKLASLLQHFENITIFGKIFQILEI